MKDALQQIFLHSLTAILPCSQHAVIEETSNPVALRRLGTRKVHEVAACARPNAHMHNGSH